MKNSVYPDIKLSTVSKCLNLPHLSYTMLIKKSGIKALKFKHSWYINQKNLFKLLLWLKQPKINRISDYAFERSIERWGLNKFIS